MVMTQTIDLRGDWAVPPTEAMRRAMAAAEVGDDNSGEDPTVIRLEEMSAELLGKEAGLFVPSGTMGNLVSVLALAEHGSEVIAGEHSHTVVYERGGAAVVGGHPWRTLPNDRFGMLDPERIEAAIRPANIHFPPTGLLMLENTHNLRGGTVIGPDGMRAMTDVARRHGVPVHLDGSRLFNASTALGVPAASLAAGCDTATFCLSKGLAAPVGSVVVGARQTIDRARAMRKLLGGGMRQAGVIAAAGIVALQQMIDRLPEDHANARRLAEGLAEYPRLSVDLETVQTNIVFFDVRPPLSGTEIASRLADEGVRLTQFGPQRLRFVTHYAIDGTAIDHVLKAVRDVLRA